MVAIIVIIVATNRRNALIVFLLITPLFFVLLGRNEKHVSRKMVALFFGAFIIATAIVAGLFEYGARERLSLVERAALPPNTSAAFKLMRSEPRPQIWGYYLKKAEQHPWIGVGFGRTLPAIYYNTHDDKALSAIDPLAVIHAHNLLLDWMLQTGLLGLAIFLSLLVAVGRRAWHARAFSRDHRLLACALLVTIAAMLLRNMTDDFLVYGIAIMFWATIGVLLGLLERHEPFNQTDRHAPARFPLNP